MYRRLLALVVLALGAVLPAAAQGVRLQLIDHIVGSELLHNAPLPTGTEVWVVGKADPRAVRLRGGYAEVVASLPQATRDQVTGNGYTQKAYPPTAQSRRSLYVLARLPDGRLFQSYVKTADAGWQPGFDAIQNGRVSMGRVPAEAAARLDAALAPLATGAAPAAARPGASPGAAPRTDTAAARTTRADSLAARDTMAAADTLTADTARTAGGVETVAAVPDEAVPVEPEPDAHPRPGAWSWTAFLAGLGAGALLVGVLVAWRYERMLKRQREHLMRLVPTDSDRARDDAERAEILRNAQEAEAQRSERVFQQIELLQEALKARDAEIQRLRRTQD